MFVGFFREAISYSFQICGVGSSQCFSGCVSKLSDPATPHQDTSDTLMVCYDSRVKCHRYEIMFPSTSTPAIGSPYKQTNFMIRVTGGYRSLTTTGLKQDEITFELTTISRWWFFWVELWFFCSCQPIVRIGWCSKKWFQFELWTLPARGRSPSIWAENPLMVVTLKLENQENLWPSGKTNILFNEKIHH